MSNQEEKKCEHDNGIDAWVGESSHAKTHTVLKSCSPICPFCKPSESKQEHIPHDLGIGIICLICKERVCFCGRNNRGELEAKQETKEYLLHNDSDVPLEVYPDFESARDAGIKKKREPMNIKTPEEIAKEIADSAFCDINDARVKLSHNQAVDIIADYISEALSAERNANLEKIRELEVKFKSLNLYIDFRKDEIRELKRYRDFVEMKGRNPVKKYSCDINEFGVAFFKEDVNGDFVFCSDYSSLESKLADAEKRIVAYENLVNTHTEMLDANSECFSKASDKIAKLEAEAKAVRSKTIEECLSVVNGERHIDLDVNVPCRCAVCEDLVQIESAIRALNNEKGE